MLKNLENRVLAGMLLLSLNADKDTATGEVVPGESQDTQNDSKGRGRKPKVEVTVPAGGFTEFPLYVVGENDAKESFELTLRHQKLNRADFATDAVYEEYRRAVAELKKEQLKARYEKSIAQVDAELEADLKPITDLKNAGIEDTDGKKSKVYAEFLKAIPVEEREDFLRMMAASAAE